MLAPPDAVSAGRLAWERLRRQSRRDWPDWLTVARAIAIGRAASLAAAGCTRPFGKRYTRAMAAWLATNGLDVNQQVRWKLLLVLDHLAEIEPWLASLDEEQRSRLNHPDSVWMNFERRGEPARAPASRRCIEHRPKPASAPVSPARAGRAIYWSSEHITRGSEGYRKCRSNDVFTIVRAVLESAVRSETDLLMLLERPAMPQRSRAVDMSALPRRAVIVSPADWVR